MQEFELTIMIFRTATYQHIALFIYVCIGRYFSRWKTKNLNLVENFHKDTTSIKISSNLVVDPLNTLHETFFRFLIFTLIVMMIDLYLD
jgi:hypothetical protein